MNNTLREQANAKINLTLDLTGRLPDGYHDIFTVMQTVTLHDTITVSPGDAPGVRLVCDAPDVPADGRNTAVKAAPLYCDAIGETPRLRIGL